MTRGCRKDVQPAHPHATNQLTNSPSCTSHPFPLVLRPAEDEGVVMVVVVEADGSSSLAVLDGASLAEVARAKLPWNLTIGFHGAFIPATA